MVHIGNTPASNFASVTKDTFSGNGSTTAFTLSKTGTTNGVAVFVENVRQIPTTAYAVSGTTLTFTAAPVSGTNNIYVLHHNTPASTATHPVAQALTATSGTFTGTVTAGSTLDMNGTELILDADADTSITADTDDRIDFRFGGTDSVHMDVSGVGVNVTNPLYPFHARAASGGDTAALFLEGPNNGYSTIYMGDTDDIDAGMINYDHSVNAFRFCINAAEKATLRNGFLKVRGSATSYDSSSGSYHEFSSNESSTTGFVVQSTNSSYTGRLSQFDLPPSDSTSNAKFIACYSSNPGGSADLEFYARVDGQIYADGSFNGGGADYAEFFEWKDGNTSDENRVGCSVVLDGNQIRKATSSDNTSNIIGVISVNPSVVGDADGEFWKGTYLKDDFGKYIFKDSEQVEWTDKEGVKYSYQKDHVPSDVTVPSDAKKTPIKVRTLNPDYDKSKTYERREDRKEWSYVGMMGKLRMLKGQPTGDRWIKMRDISDTVEEWLVR